MLLYLSHRDLKHLKLDSFVAVTLITTGFFWLFFVCCCCCFVVVFWGVGGMGCFLYFAANPVHVLLWY